MYYNPYRTAMTVVNVLLILAFIMTAFCGMSMSGYAVPFLYGIAPVSFVRRMHLSMSHWAFVLMGLHLGLHIRMLFARLKMSQKAGKATQGIFCVIAGIGFWLFLRNNMPDYLFFKVPFALLDYEKAGFLVFVENLLTLLFFVFAGYQMSVLLVRNKNQSKEGQRNLLTPVVCILAAVIIGFIINATLSSKENQSEPWGAGTPETAVTKENTATDDFRLGITVQDRNKIRICYHWNKG